VANGSGNYEQLKALAEQIGASISDLTATRSEDHDPFYVGTPTHWAMAEWFANMWEAKGFVGHGGVHLRRAHYRLREEGNTKHDGSPYTKEDWNYLCNAARYARILRDATGDPLVDPEDIIDRRNPEPHIYLNRPIEEEEMGFEAETTEMVLPTIHTSLLYWLEEDLGRPELTPKGYGYDDFYQPYHVEVWVEKSTMNDVLQPVCQRLSTNLVTGVGFMTITSVVGLLRRIEATKKPARILYVSDFDRAGKRMPTQVARQCEFWLRKYLPDADIRLEPRVLTEEQIDEYHLWRVAEVDEETGEEVIELDALESLHPGELAKIITEDIEQFRDKRLASKYWRARSEAQEALENALEEELGDELAVLDEVSEEARPIVERYERLLERLAARMQRELAHLEEKLEGPRQAIAEGVSSLEPDLPDLPKPTVGDTDDEDWLFDTRRDFMTQLMRYKTPEELAKMQATVRSRHKVCPECGAQFLSQRRDKVHCSNKCKLRAHRRKKRVS
jgi:hypothetical protein